MNLRSLSEDQGLCSQHLQEHSGSIARCTAARMHGLRIAAPEKHNVSQITQQNILSCNCATSAEVSFNTSLISQAIMPNFTAFYSLLVIPPSPRCFTVLIPTISNQ